MQDIYSQGAINMQLDTTDYNSNNGGNGFLCYVWAANYANGNNIKRKPHFQQLPQLNSDFRGS